MTARPQSVQVQQDMPTSPPWSRATRLAFRFGLLYFGTFCCATSLGGLYPMERVDDTVGLETVWPLRQITFWTAARVFGAKLPLLYRNSGSDDKIFDWVLAFCLLVFAIVGTLIWSALDRHRENYVTLNKWFRLFVRIVLASELLFFGMVKVIPNQMLFPSLSALLTPLGRLSHFSILWSSVGAVPAYEIFAGCAELLAGVLLLFHRTTMLGALLAAADMVEVWTLNMTYDVPVKLYSFHMLLLALLLLAPECRRLLDFALRDRATGPSAQPRLFSTRRANRFALAAQITVGIWLLFMNTYSGLAMWRTRGNGRPKPPVYGIWDVNELTIDGQLHSPMASDFSCWRRIVFDRPTLMSVQCADESFERYGEALNASARTIVLSKTRDPKWKAEFTFERVGQDELVLSGTANHHALQVQLHRAALQKFVLLEPSFHWVQE